MESLPFLLSRAPSRPRLAPSPPTQGQAKGWEGRGKAAALPSHMSSISWELWTSGARFENVRGKCAVQRSARHDRITSSWARDSVAVLVRKVHPATAGI